ncbi:MAG TPA: homoserine O-acetyltransferase, partial [Candidatus Nanopelagicales bacterium]
MSTRDVGRPADPLPASGAWREGDPVGARHFAGIGPVRLELGGRLDRVAVAFETWGRLNRDASNAVLVLHALTGDSHVAGPTGPGQPTAGWWDGLIGRGAPLDTDRWFVVAPNVLGGCQGTTGPASTAADGKAWGSRFPRITVRDQVAVERRLAGRLGVRRWASVIGGSMGGMRALEWAVGSPDRVATALVLAVGAAASADQIGTQSAQILAISSDPGWHGGDYHDNGPGQGPSAGLGLARRIAHLTYRSGPELEERFGNTEQAGENALQGGRYAVQSYLDHHADKLVGRFDAGSYVALTDAMNTWDVGRSRGGVGAALRDLRVPLVVAGIDSDRLYPIAQQEELADLAPSTVGGLRTVSSRYGHDGFLIEHDQVFAL